MNYKILATEELRMLAVQEHDLTLGEILFDILRPGNNKRAIYTLEEMKGIRNISDKEFYDATEKYKKNQIKD